MSSEAPSLLAPGSRESRRSSGLVWLVLGTAGLLGMTGCASSGSTSAPAADPALNTPSSATEPLKEIPSDKNTVKMPDPRVGLGAGLLDAEEAIWNLRLVSATPPPEAFVGVSNSDLAFKDNYAIQGNYNGFQIWDISNPAVPVLVKGYVCPASQSDVSVYRNLLFVSGEGMGGRLDCGTEGVRERVSDDAAARHPDLRHQRHREPGVHRERADVPRLAHALAARGPERHGQRLRLRLRLRARPAGGGASGLLRPVAGRGSRTRRSSASR